MAELDYGGAIAGFQHAGPGDIVALLSAAAAPIGGREVMVFLVDYEQAALQPLLLGEAWAATNWAELSEIPAEQDIASTVAGRCFRTGEPLTVTRGDGVRVWVPLVEQADRTGVLALTVPEASATVVSQCVNLGLFAGLLIASAARYSDIFHLLRQGRSMTAAAGMQWDLLPPMTVASARVVSTGVLEPAYEVAGDAFDHSLNDGWLHVGIFDGMGHDISSTLMTTLAVGIYRHARRARMPLPDVRRAVDTALAEHWAGDGFVTGVLLQLQLSTGRLEWTTAGHPAPLLLRGRTVVGELDHPPLLPFGLGDPAPTSAHEQLQPGDSLLLFTDGVVDGRPSRNGALGIERLADLWERETQAQRTPEEVTRRLAQAVIDHQGGKLDDDATIVLVQWHGASPDLPREDGL